MFSRRFVLLALGACVTFAQSQPPTPTPTKAAQEKQKQTAIEQHEIKRQKEPAPPPSSIPHSSEGRILDKQEAGDSGKQKSSTDWWPLVNTGLLTIFTGGLVYLAHRQRQAMDKQAKHMEDGLAATRQSADAATASANIAKGAFDATTAQIEIIRDQLEVMRVQSKYMSDGLALTKQSADAATAGAMAANEQLRTLTDQLAQMESQTRPWIGLDTENGLRTSSIFVDEQGNARIQITITARNFGNYPGQRVFSTANLVITQDVTRVYDEEKKFVSEEMPDRAGAVLFPGPARHSWQWPDVVTKEKMFRNSIGDEFAVFLVGGIRYFDQFGREHHTTFSFRYQQPGTIFGVIFRPEPNSKIDGQWIPFHGSIG